MIFSTQNQLICILIFVFFGIIFNIITIPYLIFFANKFYKKSIKIINFIIFYAFFSIFFIILINFFNFGKFSLALFTSYLVGFVWIKKLLLKTVVILEKRWYNKIVGNFKRFKFNFKIKHKEK